METGEKYPISKFTLQFCIFEFYGGGLPQRKRGVIWSFSMN